MLVMVFWWTVINSVSVEVWPLTGELCPRESALRNVLNAALLSRPTPEAPNLEAPPEVFGAVVSSRLPTACQPASDPENTMG